MMASTVFVEKYENARDRKRSILCVGLDPAVRGMRTDNIVPDDYFKGRDVGEGLLDFCLDTIDNVADHCCAVKANAQYLLFHMNLGQLKILNKTAHKEGLVTILDNKLGDIGSTNSASLHWTGEAGFDAFTFSPYAGNIRECVSEAHQKNLGVFVLTLMSNPQAVWIQKETGLYKRVARESAEALADGLVVGATGHVTSEDIIGLRDIAGSSTVFLFPGVGAQGGDAQKTVKESGNNILVNVGRSIIFSDNPKEKAEEYNKLLNSFR
ncbi:MAG: orotidine-5'-phosphate decarboxylase [Candidatus Altiarchaeota archaeon]